MKRERVVDGIGHREPFHWRRTGHWPVPVQTDNLVQVCLRDSRRGIQAGLAGLALALSEHTVEQLACLVADDTFRMLVELGLGQHFRTPTSSGTTHQRSGLKMLERGMRQRMHCDIFLLLLVVGMKFVAVAVTLARR